MLSLLASSPLLPLTDTWLPACPLACLPCSVRRRAWCARRRPLGPRSSCCRSCLRHPTSARWVVGRMGRRPHGLGTWQEGMRNGHLWGHLCPQHRSALCGSLPNSLHGRLFRGRRSRSRSTIAWPRWVLGWGPLPCRLCLAASSACMQAALACSAAATDAHCPLLLAA